MNLYRSYCAHFITFEYCYIKSNNLGEATICAYKKLHTNESLYKLIPEDEIIMCLN